MKLLFPDACWTPDLVSGSLFLYFHNEKLALTLHPSVSTFLTGADPFDFIRFVKDHNPDWLQKFSAFMRNWNIYRSSLLQTSDLLEPLRGTAFITILMSYPRGAVAWQSAEDLIASSELTRPEIAQLVDPFSASDELFSHIFFEKYLELYQGRRSAEEMIALGAKQAGHDPKEQSAHVDWAALLEYCGALFDTADLEELLTTAYMFRLPFLRAESSVLLSNPGLVQFLASLPLDAIPKPDTETVEVDLDVVSWEFFRQLVSPRLDPLDKAAVDKVIQIIQRHSADIDALKRRCFSLAQDLGSERDLEVLQKRIAQHIRGKVEGEVQAVLSLDRKALNELFDAVFSDQKTWAGIATFLYSLVNGGEVLTAGAAIYALSSIGSKAVRVASDRRKKIEISDFALLYRMRQ